MTKELEGKVAIITGGASGIGRASVKKFIEEGARVVIADLDQEAGEAYARDLGNQAAFCRTDVSQAVDVERVVAFAIDRFGDLGVMLNNAGVSGSLAQRGLVDEDFADFDRVMRIDLLGVMLGVKYAARHMVKKSGGSIISIASTGGHFAGFGVPIYRAAKAGVINFTQMAAIELGPSGVRVNCISPGPTETAILTAGLKLPPQKEARLRHAVMSAMVGAQAMPRFGQPEDIANAAIFLGSDRAAQITGHNLVVAGGMSIGDPINRMPAISSAYADALR